MRLAVISDLHLGRRDVVDSFGHEDDSFVRFLRFLEGSFERIVLLGDIFETLTARVPQQQRAELRAAREAHPEIVRRFERSQYLYVHGNHDLVAGPTLGAPEELAIEADGVRLLFTHGHRHDWIIRHVRQLSEWGVWAGGWIRRFGLHGFFRACDLLDQRLRGASVDAAHCTFQRWAMHLGHERKADVVVTGHTHLGSLAHHGPRLFLNSGTCSEGKFSFLAIDTKRGDYALHDSW
ncbi:metallophosphoesterase family protein [Vulgatibacter incomptus]|uniref:Ser/Thr protein phosphatase family protein n=1 Tax=Vulgatibacter incomptus TaxID=1391653 RepID=A0A0K1PEN2_9BACT|nr:metallophosphoesterase family protein [Vulgatibacter incomptus]AKU91993.1 Ser/Thr protein phosphatase family protein [Vulgatibacter incomptus]